MTSPSMNESPRNRARPLGRRAWAPIGLALAVGVLGSTLPQTERMARAAEPTAPENAAAAAPAADDVDGALLEVARARANVKTISGPFTQERTIGLMSTKVRSTGTLTLVRPDRLRWELAAPDSVVYWVGPEGLAYRGARGQGKVPAGGTARGPAGPNGNLAAAMDDIRILLGGDLSRLKDRYELRVLARSPEGITFEALPKAGVSAGKLEKIVFSLDRTRVMPTKATLVEGPKDRTEITFGALKRDVAVEPSHVRPPF